MTRQSFQIARIAILGIVLLFLIMGCGGGEGPVTPSNNPPVWDSLIGIQSAVPGDKSITVTFGTAADPDGDNPITYNIYYVNETGTGNIDPFILPNVIIQGITTSPYTITNLMTNGEKYHVGVRAQDSKGLEEQNTIKIAAMPSGDTQFNPVIIKSVDIPDSNYGVPGIYVTNGYVYLANQEFGLQIIDIDPIEGASIVKTIDTFEASGVYVTDGCAYVGGNGFHIIDIDPIESANIVKSVWIYGAPSIYAVYAMSGYAYVLDDLELQIIDIDPIENAEIVKSVETTDWPEGLYVTDGYAYVLDFMNSSLRIIDIEPIESASIVRIIRFDGNAEGVYVTDGYAYVVALDYGLHIIDIDPMESADIVNFVDTPGQASGVYVTDGYAYIADGDHGLQIIDINPIGSANIVSSVDTPGNATGVYVNNGYAYVLDDGLGLQIIKLW